MNRDEPTAVIPHARHLFLSTASAVPITALFLLLAIAAPIFAQVPDLTNGGVPLNTRYINLGPTGMQGWMYNSDTHPKTLLGDLNYTGQSRQILVTAVDAGSPADTTGILTDDVILGASGDGSTPTDFTSDARKSLALAIAAAEARTTPELKLRVWRAGVTSTYTLTLQNLGSYGPDAPVSDAKCDLIVENARQALLLQDNPGSFALGTLALMALDDPAHPDHAAMKAQIDSEISAIMLSNGELPGASKPGWQRGHSLIVLAEYYLNYGEHPGGGVLASIEAYVDDITQGQSIFGTFGHIFAQFRWPDGDTTPMMGGYGAINSSSVPGLYGLMLAKECGVSNPALDESINRGLTFYGSYADRGAIPYGEHAPASNEFSTNGKSGAAALAFELATGKEDESKYFAKMSAAAFHEYETGHTGSFFQSWWSPLGAAHAGDDAIKSYFAEISWLFDLARKWDGSFAYNHITTHDNYIGFNSSMPYVMTYALSLKRLHMTGRGRTSAGVLNASERAEAVYSANYDETVRTKTELIADLGDWAGPVHVRAATALAGMSLTSTDMDSLHALASDPLGASREGALMALEQIQDPASAPVLSAILSDPDPHIRRLAARALILNPAKAGELNAVLAATAAADRPVFPMDARDPLQHDLADMGKLLFGDDLIPAERGILFYGGTELNLTGVDRQLLYPAVRAVAGCSVGIGRSSLNKLFAALDQTDMEALGDVMVDTALYRAPADPMFADPARKSAMDALTAYRFAEAIPVAERSIRGDFASNANRPLYGEMFKDLQQFGGTNQLVTPDPAIDQLCIDYIDAHWNTFGAENNVAEAYALLDVMETDDSVAEPVYLKSFDWIVTDAAELTLPANQTQLHASVTDHAKGDLTYTWRKVYGPGNVTFSDNGTATSKDTTVAYDNTPGPYLFEVAVIDARGLSEIKGTVAMTLYDSSGNLPSNSPPTADPLPVTVAPLTPTPITLTGSDPESAPLVFTVTSLPRHGTLFGAAPNLTYISDMSYHNGTDSFTFQVTDSFGQTSSATVSITVDSSTLVTHVHESFDYAAGAGLAGNAGGTGMAGSWLDGPDGGLAWIYDETTATTPVNTGHGTLSWDGVIDNLPTLSGPSSKYVGLNGTGGDKFEIHRGLAQDAGTMAGPDNVLWASIAYHRDANSFAQHIGFALSSDCFTNQGKSLDTSGNHGSGAGDGIGLSRPYDVGSSYAAVVFNGGSPAASTTAPEFASGDFIMVLKFEFGAVDKVSAYAFREDDIVSEDSFDSRAVTASAAIDESTLNQITVAAGRGDPAYDEIRIGDSFAAVLGLGESPADVTPPAPDPMTFAVAPAVDGASSITMTATTAADSSGVEYYFTCTSGPGNDSGWQDSTSYTDSGLGAGEYVYTVKARDKSSNRNATAASAPAAATIAASTPGEITWEVYDILGNVNEVSTAGTLVQAHAGADLGTGNVVDGTTMTINTVVFNDGFVFDSPSNLDTIGSRAGANTSGDYRTLLQFADRQSSGTATFTFNGLTVGNTYQIQVWHSDNVSTALENGMVLNTGGLVETPTIGSSGHVTVLREASEGNAGQYAVGTFVADATSQQFLAKAYGNLTTSPSGQNNITINASQLRLIATGSVPDTTPPALSPSNIVDDQGGASVPVGAVVLYELTFSEDMDPATVNSDDFSNAGTSSVTIGTIVQLSPNVYQVRMTALTAGTLQLQLDAGAVLTDIAGNALDTASAILDDNTITVDAVGGNDAPVANDDFVVTNEDTAVAITLVANDPELDPLSYSVVTGPSNGILSGTAPNLIYTPNGDFNGSDSFTFKANDGTMDSNTATISITVNAINDAPYVNAGLDDTVALSSSGGGGSSVSGAYYEWDASADSAGDNLWTSSTANSWDWAFDSGNLSPVAISDARFDTLTVAYDFPAAKDSNHEDFQTLAPGSDQEPATFEFVIDVDGNDGVILECGGTGDGLMVDVAAGVLRVIVEEDPTDVVATYMLTPNDLSRFIHVVAVIDNFNDVVQLYVDGALQDSQPWTVGEDWTGTDNGGLGAYNNVIVDGGSTADFTGKIALMRFYKNKAFDANEVTTNFDALSTGAASAVTTLDGTVSDVDVGDTVNASWSQFSGPGAVIFGDPAAVDTTATFDAAGIYVLRLTADDGTVQPFDEVEITVEGSGPSNAAPTWTVDPVNETDATEDTAYTSTLADDASDADVSDTLTFAKVSGPAWLNVAADGTLSGTPTNDDVGLNVFMVSVTDSIDPAVNATLNITVINTNDAPVFTADPIAGSDATEDFAYSGTIASSASDVDAGASLTYAKVNGPAWLSVAANGDLSGTPGNGDVGLNSFTVSVTDGVIATPVEATLDIPVLDTNDAPVWLTDPVNESDATEDTAYSATLAGDATDIDPGASLIYAKVGGPAWLSVATNGTLSGTPSNSDVGANVFTVSVSDGIATAVEATLNITVINTNDAPVFTADPIAGADATEDSVYSETITASATDDDSGDTLTYAKVSGPAWLSVAADGTLSGTPDNSDVGANAFTVSVTDGNIATPIEATLNITVINTNDAPVFTVDPITGSDATEDATYSGTISGSATDEDVGDTLTHAKVSGPAWLSVSVDGTLSGTPSSSDVGVNVFSVSVDDGNGGSETAGLNITVNQAGGIVLLGGFDGVNNTAIQSAAISDIAVTLTSTINGVPGDVTNGYSQINTALWGTTALDVDAPTIGNGDDLRRAVMAQATQSNPYTLILTVTNNGTSDLSLDQIHYNVKKDIPGEGPNAGTLTYTTGDLADADGANTAFVIPDGITGNDIPLSGFLTDVTLASGESATFTWSHGAPEVPTGNTGLRLDNFAISGSVSGVPSNSDPVWATNPINEIAATEDSVYSTTLADDASDADTGDTLTFAKVSGPAWLTVAANGDLSGTPDNADVGANAFTVSVTDGVITTPIEATLNISVINANDAPVFSADPFAASDATEDSAYSGTIAGSAMDVDAGDSLTYTKVSGPAWLSVAGNGTLSGIPSNADVGSNAFTVSVDDGNGGSDTATLNITVINTNDAPVFTVDPITGGNATEDAAYSGTIAGTTTDDDGDTPSYSKAGGPAWLNVASNGDLSGTPTSSDIGLNTFTVSVSDGNGGNDTASLEITVDPAPSVSKLFRTTVSAVSNSGWMTVDLGQVYNSAVVVATPVLPTNTHPPVVTRLRNVSGSSFDLMIERIDGQTGSVSVDVHIIAVEEGVYTVANDGVKMEAVKYTSTITSGKGSWTAESRSYQNSYTNPVVVGQVMTANDANWSVFWCQGSNRTSPPDASNLNTGKHVGEDPITTRANETVGCIVIESGTGSMDGLGLVAGLGSDIVRGPDDSSSGYNYSISGLSSASAAAASLAGMDGADGGFAVLTGATPLTSTTITLYAEEDQLNDSERKHTTEQAGYLVIE